MGVRMIFVVLASVEGPSERRLDFFFFGLLGKILWAVLAASDAALYNPETRLTAGPSIKSECRPTKPTPRNASLSSWYLWM